MIVVGVILALLGLLLAVPILWVIGLVLIVVGASTVDRSVLPDVRWVAGATTTSRTSGLLIRGTGRRRPGRFFVS